VKICFIDAFSIISCYVVLLVLFIGENADLLYQELTSDDDHADRGNL
jgi:hypothetical protein